MLSKEAIRRGLADRTIFALTLGVQPRRLREWLYHGVLPSHANLIKLTEATGDKRYLTLRPAKKGKP